ncbi:Uncharacterized protein SCF082_LOCUS37181 [Durusdinium trenchii]|uniref:Uncharacterized protein n=1 Tax=Durusdinium trenchii TaxID=1381693 RepID=A0ABP0PPT4_9DINO
MVPRPWWWMKLVISIFYVFVLLYKVMKLLWFPDVARSSFSSVFKNEDRARKISVSSVIPSVPSSSMENLGVPEELDRFRSTMAYTSLTFIVAPFCALTTVLSLFQDLEGMEASLTSGGSNAIPLLVILVLWFRQDRLPFQWRLRIWLLLASWFLAVLFIDLVQRDWHLDQNVWLNHMVFVMLISASLQLPKLLIWCSASVHTAGFLTITILVTEEQAPSMGLQIFLFVVLAMTTEYASVLTTASTDRVKAKLDYKEAKIKAERYEYEAIVADVTVREEAARAEMLEAKAEAIASVQESLMSLLTSVCDAVVQLDHEMKLVEAKALSILLYQSTSPDLTGHVFTDLLSKQDRDLFDELLARVSPDEGKSSFARITLRGSYDVKIPVTAYVSRLSRPNGENMYFLGLSEDQLEDWSSRGQGPEPDAPDIASTSLNENLPFSSLLREEQAQAMVSFLWTWPLAPKKERCCELHAALKEAADVIKLLEEMKCQEPRRSFTWQCPACKLLGMDCDQRLYNHSKGACGRCINWDELY